MMSGRNAFLSATMLFICCLCFLTACGQEKPTFTTEYQAVFMDNGQAFFGKLSHAGAAYPFLNGCIGRQASPDGKEVKNVLLKRGNERHGPEYMYINRRHIVVVEPVGCKAESMT